MQILSVKDYCIPLSATYTLDTDLNFKKYQIITPEGFNLFSENIFSNFKDAKINNYTTMEGMVKKYKKGDEEFDLPQRILDLYKAKDYGRFADKDGSLHVNFLTDNDITGGNSGSPVLNGKGELIGLAFDGNIEAMAGDVIFDNKLQRTINVDIRFVLWVIENYSGAKHIVDEMTLVK